MAYRCNQCGFVGDSSDFTDGWSDAYSDVKFSHCSCCNSRESNPEEVFQCCKCDEYFTEDEMTGNKICNKCLEDYATIDELAEYGNQYPDEVKINSFYAYLLGEDKIANIIKTAAEMCLIEDPETYTGYAQDYLEEIKFEFADYAEENG